MRVGRQAYGRVAGVAVVGLPGCLVTGACSAGGSGISKTDASSPAPSAVALCHRTLTPADLPADIPTTRGAAPDCSDPNNGDVGYIGNQGLAAVFEDLTLKPDATQTAAEFSDYVQSESLVALNSVESDATPYRDLGDQVVYLLRERRRHLLELPLHPARSAAHDRYTKVPGPRAHSAAPTTSMRERPALRASVTRRARSRMPSSRTVRFGARAVVSEPEP